jgi:glycyl-tRNA synthetase
MQYGIDPNHIRIRRHGEDELSHYAKATSDIEYLFPWGWGELEGVANRTDFDLRRHSEHSGTRLDYFDEASGERITPYIIEPSGGVDRAALTFMIDAYQEQEAPKATGGSEKRVFLKLHPKLAPIKAAILPLSRNPELTPLAKEVYFELLQLGRWAIEYDDSQSIGRRYRRFDEIGTPLCITVDFESMNDQSVTIRYRDTMNQERVAISELEARLTQQIG